MRNAMAIALQLVPTIASMTLRPVVVLQSGPAVPMDVTIRPSIVPTVLALATVWMIVRCPYPAWVWVRHIRPHHTEQVMWEESA